MIDILVLHSAVVAQFSCSFPESGGMKNHFPLTKSRNFSHNIGKILEAGNPKLWGILGVDRQELYF